MKTSCALVWAMVAIAWSLSGCESKTVAPPGPPASSAAPGKQAKKHPAEAAVEAFNRKDWTGVLSSFTPEANLILLDSTQDPVRGHEGLRSLFEHLVLTFPDARIELVRLLDGDGVWLAEMVLTGTQLGEFLGQPVKEKRVGLQVALYAMTKGGRIDKALLCGNPLAIIRQLQSEGGGRRWLPPAPVGSEIITRAGDRTRPDRVRAFFRIFETADLAALGKHVTDDVVVHAYGDGKRIQGLEALRLTLVREREAFDGKIEVEHAAAVGSYVAAVIKIHGTIKANVGPLKATGKHFAERGIDLFRFEGDKIAEWDNYRNLLDLMRQLGMQPSGAVKNTPESDQGKAN